MNNCNLNQIKQKVLFLINKLKLKINNLFIKIVNWNVKDRKNMLSNYNLVINLINKN